MPIWVHDVVVPNITHRKNRNCTMFSFRDIVVVRNRPTRLVRNRTNRISVFDMKQNAFILKLKLRESSYMVLMTVK